MKCERNQKIKTLTMPKEESILESYFLFISNFSHDRAREVIEKEKELSRSSSSSCWTQLLSVLLNLSTAEKTYHSLTFLSPRTGSVFLRKEQSLKSVYQSLLLDCRNALELRKALNSKTQWCDKRSHFTTQNFKFLKF